MFDILKDFYRGRLVPDEKDGPNRPYIQDLLRLREGNREKLCQGLTEEQKEILEKYDRQTAEMIELIREDSFINGFRTGTRMTAEAFTKE